ncbi:MAG: hypothetical protein SF187_17515 [Deltaproteobacteria bacterium]|nr:hypothetical protein [Deltaproteobacteria bacterium]
MDAFRSTATFCAKLPPDLAVETIRQLVAKVPNAEVLLNGNDPPVAYASTTECARALLSAGAKLEYEYEGQPQSVLVRVPTFAERLPVYEEFLKLGADPNFRGPLGLTVMMQTSKPEYIKLLARYGADPNLKDDEGLNALDHAYQEKDQEKADALIAVGAKIGTFVNSDHAQADYAYKNQHAILGGGGSGSDSCRVSVRTHSSMFADGGNTWTMSVGTELDITVRCLDGGVLHAAVVPRKGDIEVYANLFMMEGVGTFKFRASKPYDSARLRFFRSQGSVENLAAAVADGKARAVAQRTITAAVPQ